MNRELQSAADRLAAAWFDKLWSKRRLEIEVHAERRRRARCIEEGLRLWAPFGLGTQQTEWWVPVRRRSLMQPGWKDLRSVGEAEAELGGVLLAALRYVE